jgi:hypothetical protein
MAGLNRLHFWMVVLFSVSFFHLSFAQLSLMAEASGVSIVEGDGEYTLNNRWPGDNATTV